MPADLPWPPTKPVTGFAARVPNPVTKSMDTEHVDMQCRATEREGTERKSLDQERAGEPAPAYREARLRLA